MSSTTLDTFQTLQGRGRATTAEALALFDQLDPVALEWMMGRWRGSEFPTGHALDGVLTVANWYGKEFVNPDCVHPLVCLDNHNRLFNLAVNPTLFKVMLKLPLPKHPALKPLFTWLNAQQKTAASQAHLRLVDFRGKVSAAMIYNELPIQDVFRKVDENTVLGLMDYGEFPEPFFFVLQRDIPETSPLA
jgi:hypothetical protein